jgi:hypothetical protein
MKLALPLLAFASLLPADVKTDFTSDFNQYKTYSWIAAKSAHDPWAALITRDIDARLAAKGWIKLQSGGDLVVSAFGLTNDKKTLDSNYTDFGGPWKWQQFGTADRKVDDIPVGTLIVDVFDGKSKRLVWSSSATEVLAQKPDSAQLKDSIVYMFRDFPQAHP